MKFIDMIFGCDQHGSSKIDSVFACTKIEVRTSAMHIYGNWEDYPLMKQKKRIYLFSLKRNHE